MPTVLQQFSVFQHDTFRSVSLKILQGLRTTYECQDFPGKLEKLRVLNDLEKKIENQSEVNGRILIAAARADDRDAMLITQLLFCKKVRFTQADIDSVRKFSPKGAIMMEKKRSSVLDNIESNTPDESSQSNMP